MDEDEFILAINPDPTKPCVLVEREKYDLLQDVITDNLLAYGPLTLVQLAALVADQLQEDFDGPIMRYCETVKLDMEVRGEIRRAPKFNQVFSAVAKCGTVSNAAAGRTKLFNNYEKQPI